jgi:hypothetical protein
MLVKAFVSGYFAVETVAIVLAVGRPREPLKPRSAAFLVAINMAIFASILIWW